MRNTISIALLVCAMSCATVNQVGTLAWVRGATRLELKSIVPSRPLRVIEGQELAVLLSRMGLDDGSMGSMHDVTNVNDGSVTRKSIRIECDFHSGRLTVDHKIYPAFVCNLKQAGNPLVMRIRAGDHEMNLIEMKE